jgi:hypothetical protein
VWLYNPPRGPKATKFVHPWMGPLRVREAIGYENYLLRREDKTGKAEDIVAHASFLASYRSSVEWLKRAAADLTTEVEDEYSGGVGHDVAEAGAVVRAATAPGHPQEANESAQRQQHEQDSGRTRVTDWRRFEGDGGATKLGSTCPSTCCSPPTIRQELASPARGGSPPPSTATCSMLERPWKTFRVRKACDEWRSTEATSR